MQPFLEFVEGIESGITMAREVTVSGKTDPVVSDSKVLIFSPHPDDECITGLLPLRLMREAGMQIINIPVTFGSVAERQAGRSEELENACAYLGWDIHRERENFQSLEVNDVLSILQKFEPEIIIMPHSKD